MQDRQLRKLARDLKRGILKEVKSIKIREKEIITLSEDKSLKEAFYIRVAK
jgi:hypothetical protein